MDFLVHIAARVPKNPRVSIVAAAGRRCPNHGASTISTMTRLFAIDPGPKQSAYVVRDAGRIVASAKVDNLDLLARLKSGNLDPTDVLVIEGMQAMGMAVGKEVFETVFWSGRFVEAWTPRQWFKIFRTEVKVHICGSVKAKDSNIRTAIIDRFGDTAKEVIGSKKRPGVLYGIAGDQWSALAIAITAEETILRATA